MNNLAKLLGVVALVTAGCVTSEPIDLRPLDADVQPIMATTGTGGAPSLAGQAGAGIAGSSGGPAGATGGGVLGSGAAGATVGSSGAAGASGSAGTQDAGATDTRPTTDAGALTDAGGDASAYAATWTDIYNKMLNNMAYASNCTGSACHDPGKQKGLDFSSQATGYTTVKGHLVVGNPTSSQLVQKISSGSMPAGRPKMPVADLNVIKAWIMAGALNN